MNSLMDPKLKRPLVSNFKAAGPQIAYLSPASEAFIMNVSAIIGTRRGQKLRNNSRVALNVSGVRRHESGEIQT